MTNLPFPESHYTYDIFPKEDDNISCLKKKKQVVLKPLVFSVLKLVIDFYYRLIVLNSVHK